MEQLNLPIQKLAKNIGTEGEAESISDETKSGRKLGYEYLKQIDAKLNSVLRILKVEVNSNGEADN